MFETEPNPLLPDVPTITADHPGFADYLPWGPFFGIFVKQGTPDEAVTKLQDAYAQATTTPEFGQLMEDRGFSVMNISGDEAEQFLNKWQSVTSWLVHDAGITKKSPEEFGIPRP